MASSTETMADSANSLQPNPLTNQFTLAPISELISTRSNGDDQEQFQNDNYGFELNNWNPTCNALDFSSTTHHFDFSASAPYFIPAISDVSTNCPDAFPIFKKFPLQTFNWKSNIESFGKSSDEANDYTDFNPLIASEIEPDISSILPPFPSSIPRDNQQIQQQSWNVLEPLNISTQSQSSEENFSGTSDFRSKSKDNNQYLKPRQDPRRLDDGYNWRKYGQKQVKGSENPRSYYKCTHPDCPVKKKVETNSDGCIVAIIYKGNHNHLKRQSKRLSSSFLGNTDPRTENSATPENSSSSIGDDFEEIESDAKRLKENEGEGAIHGRTVKDTTVVIQTTSDVDVLDDGYKWRKYGQKLVKGKSNPRSYYKCIHQTCPVKKKVERAEHDKREVLTTYEGKHNHDVPTSRTDRNRPAAGYLLKSPSNQPSSSSYHSSTANHGYQRERSSFIVGTVNKSEDLGYENYIRFIQQ